MQQCSSLYFPKSLKDFDNTAFFTQRHIFFETTTSEDHLKPFTLERSACRLGTASRRRSGQPSTKGGTGTVPTGCAHFARMSRCFAIDFCPLLWWLVLIKWSQLGGLISVRTTSKLQVRILFHSIPQDVEGNKRNSHSEVLIEYEVLYELNPSMKWKDVRVFTVGRGFLVCLDVTLG